MRHNKSGRKLGRTWEHRKAMFRNMAKSLLVHGKIRTTEAKAKELRKVADKLVTLALRNDLHSRRLAFKVLGDHALVKTLFDEVGTQIRWSFRRIYPCGENGAASPVVIVLLWHLLNGRACPARMQHLRLKTQLLMLLPRPQPQRLLSRLRNKPMKQQQATRQLKMPLNKKRLPKFRKTLPLLIKKRKSK